MLALAIDLGGSHASAALVNETGIVAQRTIAATAGSFRAMLAPLETMAADLLQGAGVPSGSCDGIVFGFPGAVDCRTSRVLSTNAKFEDALDFDFQAWAHEQFRCRLLLDNDARLALIGEHHAGAARGFQDAAMILLGTGIGTAVLLNGKPLRGLRNQAGSLGGHLPVRLHGRRCTCGGVGCAEAEASTWALSAVCREWAEFPKSKLAQSGTIDFRALFAAIDAGDQIAKEVFEHCMDIWGALAVAITHAYSPQVILLGGGVLARAKDMLPGLQARLNRDAWMPGGAVTIKPSALGSSAALHAAIPLLQEITPGVKSRSTYDRFPAVRVSDSDEACYVGWQKIAEALQPLPPVTVVEVYPGCDTASIERALASVVKPELIIRAEEAFLPAEQIETTIYATLGTDRVFAFMRPWTLDDFFCPEKLASLRGRIHAASGPVLVIGTGAALIPEKASRIVYADISRWEIQARQRARRCGNLGIDNRNAPPSELYRRAFFIEWRAADRLKQSLLQKIDFLLDTHIPDEPKMLGGDAFRNALAGTARRPFRVVPFFDPGPWGGHWMKEKFDLPDGPPNYAWCFDCVPEENSLRLAFGSCIVEVPAIDLVFFKPQELLGANIYESFGAEFPIRFDYLDTMGGGNLSLQVHPHTRYIREAFGMAYTQDESYYMLDAGADGTVFLGLKEDADPALMERDLRLAQQDSAKPFPAENYVNEWPARKHDHFLIPAGTTHCSGRDGVVLEISATPYIFTFKLWDWGRTGLDGRPRPIHLDHGLQNIDWSRRTRWVEQNLINQFEELGSGPGWREERTGLHRLEFIETRRHWFTAPVPHDTNGTVNVLNLVDGDHAIVESPTGAFPPLEIHYGETFIVPADVGPYTIRPAHSVTEPMATMKAFVRETPDHA